MITHSAIKGRMNTRLIAKQYERGALIGRGAVSAVYRGRDVGTGRPVTIKQLLAALVSDADQFTHDSAALAALDYPSIVKVLATATTGSRFSIVLEHIEG